MTFQEQYSRKSETAKGEHVESIVTVAVYIAGQEKVREQVRIGTRPNDGEHAPCDPTGWSVRVNRSQIQHIPTRHTNRGVDEWMQPSPDYCTS